MLALILRTLFFLYVTLTCTGCLNSVAGVYPAPPGEPTNKTIHVVSNGWHTSIVLRSEDLTGDLQKRLENFSRYPWLDLGWGDEGFFRADKITAGITVQAAFFSRGSVAHLRGLYSDPVTYFSDYQVTVYRLDISQIGRAHV